MSAARHCASIQYWVGDGELENPVSQGYASTAFVHEVFHLFGFMHPGTERPGVVMSDVLYAPWEADASAFTATEEDIAALGCVLPKPPE